MAKYPVLASCFLSGRFYSPGDTVDLTDADAAAALVAHGTLGEPARPVRKGRPAAGKRSAWTPDDDEDDQEG